MVGIVARVAAELIPGPVSRLLRIIAFDPSVSAQVSTAAIGEIKIAVLWENSNPDIIP